MTKPCIWCSGNGHYASPMTNWDWVICDRCNGTGEANALVRVGEQASRQLIAQLDAYANDEIDTLQGVR
jgi:hypothetical protein